MNSLSVQFQNISIWTALVCIAIFTILFLSFRHSSTQSKPMFGVLLALRIFVYIFIIILIVKPIVSWEMVINKRPTVLLFVDDSQSMTAHRGIDQDSLQKVVQNVAELGKNHLAELVIIPFGLSIGNEPDRPSDLTFTRDGTNISNVLKYCETDPDKYSPDAAIILSDGVSNSGEEPVMLKSFPRIPVFTVGVGDSLMIMDPAVVDVSAPFMSGIGDSVTIEARVLPLGYGGMVSVTLQENGRIIRRKNIPATPQALNQKVTFNVVPDHSGIFNYCVLIDTTRDRNPINNVKYARMRVYDNRVKLVIIQGQNSFDVRFFTMVCSSIPEIETIKMTAYKGKWYSESTIDPFQIQWDVVAFFGFPTNDISPDQFESVAAKINRDDPALYIQILPDVNIEMLNRLLPYPVIRDCQKIKTDANSVSTRINDISKQHPVFMNLISDKQLKRDWSELPPVGMTFKKLQLSPGYFPIIETEDQAAIPVMSLCEKEGNRCVFVSGLDIWRWGMMTTGGTNHYIYPNLMNSLIKWMSDTLSTSNMQFSLDKDVYFKGELAEVSGVVTDVDGKIVSNAALNAQIVDERNKTVEFLIQWDGSKYRGDIPLTEEGKFQIIINGKIGEFNVGNCRRSIRVLPNSVEYQVIRQNNEALKEIAVRTDGSYFSLGNYKLLSEKMDLETRVINREYIRKIWRWPGIFILLLSALAAEWIIRRSNGYQ